MKTRFAKPFRGRTRPRLSPKFTVCGWRKILHNHVSPPLSNSLTRRSSRPTRQLMLSLNAYSVLRPSLRTYQTRLSQRLAMKPKRITSSSKVKRKKSMRLSRGAVSQPTQESLQLLLRRATARKFYRDLMQIWPTLFLPILPLALVRTLAASDNVLFTITITRTHLRRPKGLLKQFSWMDFA